MDAGERADSRSASFLMRIKLAIPAFLTRQLRGSSYVSLHQGLQEGIFCLFTFSVFSIRHSPNLRPSSCFSLRLSYTNVTASTQPLCHVSGMKCNALRVELFIASAMHSTQKTRDLW